MARSAIDPEWWIDYFVDTFDPRGDGAHDLPFLLYPFQRQVLQSIYDHYLGQRDLAQLKSRTMGMTWLNLAFILNRWLFEDGFTALVGSFREKEVDNGKHNINTLFGKLDYMLQRLPGWMIPLGYSERKQRRNLLIDHPLRTNIIQGSSAVGDFSRGGRFRMIFIDEGAAWEHPTLENAWASTSQSARFRLLTSTSKGQDDFCDIYRSGVDTQRIHWSVHPLYDDAWYEDQKIRIGSAEKVAQELDCSFEHSAANVCYPAWRDGTVVKGHFPYNPKWPLWISVDFGLNDPTALVYWQRDPESQRFRMLAGYERRGQSIDFYVPFFTGMLAEEDKTRYSAEDLAFLSMRSLWGSALVYGDPAGKQRNQATGVSVLDVLAEKGVTIVTNDSARDYATRHRLTSIGLRQLDVNIAECRAIDDAMNNSRFPERRGNRSTSELEKPIHDQWSHFRSAIEYLFVNIPGLQAINRPKPTFRTRPWQQLRPRMR